MGKPQNKNNYWIEGDLCYMECSGLAGTVIIDAEDLPLLEKRSWYRTGYKRKYIGAGSSFKDDENKRRYKVIYLHRVIMGLEHGDERQVDHINQNPFDCRKANMRICSMGENNFNRSSKGNRESGYRGVIRVGNRFHARIVAKKVRYHIGCYDTPKEAALAYDEKCRELHGAFANTNFDL